MEVNPVLRKEIRWSPYKKVPILLTKVEEGYRPLNDSTMIISLLASHLHNTSHQIEELAEYYPSIGIHDDSGKFKYEIINKYFLMFNRQLPKNRTMNDITYVQFDNLSTKRPFFCYLFSLSVARNAIGENGPMRRSSTCFLQMYIEHSTNPIEPLTGFQR